MSPRAKEPPKRGRGRPPIDPEGDSVRLEVRLGQEHYLELRRLIDAGDARTMPEAIRVLIERSARNHRPGVVN